MRLNSDHTDASDRTGRAVSDVIGFSLMFGIIIVSVGIVSVGGVDNIISFGDREEIATGERGMEAAAATLDEMNRGSDWNRSFDLVAGTGQVWVNQTALTFVDGPDALAGERIQINSLEHRFDRFPEDITVNYEGGGAWRSDSIVPGYDPALTCARDSAGNPDTAIISLVNLTTSDGDINVAVDFNRQFAINPTDIPSESPVAAFAATLTLQATLDDWETYTATDESLTIDVSETSNPEAWSHHLDSTGWEEVSDGTFSCDADTVVVRIMTIDLERLL